MRKVSISDDYGPWTVVVGAAAGIGYAFCDALARAGRNILMTDIDSAALEAAAGRLRRDGVIVETVVMDSGDGDSWCTTPP